MSLIFTVIYQLRLIWGNISLTKYIMKRTFVVAFSNLKNCYNVWSFLGACEFLGFMSYGEDLATVL